MSKFHLLLPILAMALLLSSCKGSKKSTAETAVEDTMEEKSEMVATPMDLMIKKGNCFGRCPVFEMDINADGSMEYRGKMFVERTGIWKGQLPAGQLQTLQQQVAAADVFQYEEQYRSGATDFPTHVLRVSKDEQTKSVAGDFALPAPVKTIIAHIDSLGKGVEWKQYEAQVPRDAIPGEILAKLNTDGHQDLVNDLQDYGVRMKKRIAPNLPMYVFSFIPEDVSAGRLLVLFREHPNVEMAQFNQEVAERE